MLINMRKTAGSWVVKGLLLLLVVSFAVWGVGDILRTPVSTAVAVIGEREISQVAFNDAYRRAFQRLQRQLGDALADDDAQRLGLAEATLEQMVTEAALDQAAARYGLVVSAALVAQDIRRTAAFRNARGEFDVAIYDRVLRDSGVGVEYFEALRRAEIVRELLAGALARGVAAPAALADAIYGYRAEQRGADYVVVSAMGIAEPPAPDEAALAAFHREHGERFMAPEYRALTFLSAAPEDVVAEVEIDDLELRDEYEARKEEFHRPARRDLEQLLYPDRATADQAMARLTAGEALATVAATLPGFAPGATALGWLIGEELPETLQGPVFAAPAPGVVGPVESPFGWHVVRIVAAEPEAQEPYEAVRERLKGDLALDRARDQVTEIGNQIEDLRAGGATIEEVANRLGLTLVTVAAVDAAGLDRDGQAVDALPADPEFRRLTFATAAGEETDLTEDDAGGYFVLRVDTVVAAAVRPIETVREAVAAAWREAE
ncbi:MAG: hypothetical protein FJX53_15575, partial [Alphaproteobacteria bacterium]|nr:hypothetical protein [Alphaproteobacteria bacterium]